MRTPLTLSLLLVAGCSTIPSTAPPADPLTAAERAAWEKYRATHAKRPWGATSYFPAQRGWLQRNALEVRHDSGLRHHTWPDLSSAEQDARYGATHDPRIACGVVVNFFTGPDPQPVSWYTHDREGKGTPPESVAPGLGGHLRALQKKALRGEL